MAERTQKVALERLDSGKFEEDARRRLAEVLGVEVPPPDDLGIVEVEVEADSWEDAVQRVLDAIDRAGADDHFVLAEHD
ncbi:MAG: hypothetical protein ACJ76V_04535 [Thermoleophilaceae bacterium]